MKVTFALIALFSSFNLFSQNRHKIDSLLNILELTTHDTNKVQSFSLLSIEFRSNNPDKAFQYGNQGLLLAQKINYKKGIAQCYYNIGLIHQEQGNYEKSIECSEISLKMREAANDKKGISSCYVSIGNVYYLRGVYDKAIEYYLKSAKIAEVLGNKKVMAANYQNIGIVCKEQGNYDKVINYYKKALILREELGDKKGIAESYTAIGIVYTEKGFYEKAIKYNNDALKIMESLGNKKGIISNYTCLGLVYYKQGKNIMALEYFKKALKICNELGDKNFLSTVLPNLASVMIKLKKYEEALSYAQQGLSVSQKIGSLDNIRLAYAQLYETYDSLDNSKQALKYHKLLSQVKDSIYSETKHKQLSQLEAVYQDEKKQKEIALLEKDKVLQKSEIKRQTTQKYALLGGLCFMLILASVILFSYKKIRTQKRVIEEKNTTLGQQNIEIAAHRDLVTQQKEHIEEIYHEISDSINYAKRIQQAVLPTGDYANNILGEHFILFNPKDVVSGDFYWATCVNKWLVVTVADCTGHGVPGAFMSMLGISFLNEIVRKKEITQASHVLDHLRNYVIEALKQKGQSGEQKDGMDISLIVLNTETLECQFSGANNPLWISINCDYVSYTENYIETIKNNNLISAKIEGTPPNQSNIITINRTLLYYELIELKPDKMPVAIYDNMKPFSNHIINLCKGDMIYLASDGFEDQFGGPRNKKFLSKNMKELIRSNSHKPMLEQKELLEKAINDWKGESEQIDDITVMGIKI